MACVRKYVVKDKHLRESHFPAIEKRYGEPMSHWFSLMKRLQGKKYPEQIAYLRENFGFSQAHANALVMYSRGSKSSKRYGTPTEYFKSLNPQQAKTMRRIFRIIRLKYPRLKLVIAWNQPVLRDGERYIFGCSASKNHLLIAPWDRKIIREIAPLLGELKANQKTIRVPIDWKVDDRLLLTIIKKALARSNMG